MRRPKNSLRVSGRRPNESFAVHHPTLYQAALSSPTVLLICAFAVMLMPWFIPAWIAALFYVAFLMSIHLIVSNFHRFG